MIQDIYPHKLNNHYNPHVQIEREDIVLCIVNGKILVQEKRWEEKWMGVKNITFVSC